ncbi:MAG: TauD/TfdA family dioxygenase [Rhodospirillaceae bacterium]|jgi:alpha-ketoglutarate-dependent taurine dioxygenase|nr:TauD/TfdA family dioxygenase [Rhodospirillaceae bacterium]
MTPIHDADPAKWTPGDFPAGKADIAVDIPAAGLATLEKAARAILNSGRPMVSFDRADLPMPGLAEELEAVSREIDRGRGIVILRGFPVADRPLAEVEAMFWAVGRHLGDPVSQSVMGDRLGHITDVTDTDPDARAYRANWELSLHTDMSDIVSFLCVRRAAEGGISRFTSAVAIHDAMARRHPELLDILYRGFPWHRFGEQAVGEAPITEHRIPHFSEREGFLSCRYVRNYIREAAHELGALSAREEEALDTFDALARSPEFCLEVMLEPGEAVIMNNYAVLHARSAFRDGADAAKKRLLLRLWMASRTPRPTRPEIEIYGAGRTGGIAPREGAAPSFKRRASSD